MMKNRVKNSDQALVYIADCQLATVSDLAMKKSRGVGNYRRHISIAQTAVDWIILFQIDHKDTSRIEKIVNCYNGSVALWAKQYEQ